MIYPFLIYGIIVWGNTYPSTMQPLFVLQKKAMRIITFSEYNEHSSPYIASFMYKFHHRLLPSAFDNFFTPIDRIHNYNTRLASKQSYYLPKARTNYGLFNIRFQGTKIWNSMDENIKLFSFSKSKNKLKSDILHKY